jgi:hypothetical protein
VSKYLLSSDYTANRVATLREESGGGFWLWERNEKWLESTEVAPRQLRRPEPVTPRVLLLRAQGEDAIFLRIGLLQGALKEFGFWKYYQLNF